MSRPEVVRGEAVAGGALISNAYKLLDEPFFWSVFPAGRKCFRLVGLSSRARQGESQPCEDGISDKVRNE